MTEIRSLHALAVVCVLLAAAASAQAADATTTQPDADFLFIGSYHMSNPGLDVANTKADNVLAPKRQAEIMEITKLIERYRPTKVMIEVDTAHQQKIQQEFQASCKGQRPLEGDETEQLGYRIACDSGLSSVQAVDWNDLGPIKDEDSIDYTKAVERHQQQAEYQSFLTGIQAWAASDQIVLDHGSVGDMLRHLNSDDWRQTNARTYYKVAQFGTPDDAIGANWVQLWFGRNLRIFNNIDRATVAGDRVLVIYGAGHGNYINQLAADSGRYRMQDPQRWLKP